MLAAASARIALAATVGATSPAPTPTTPTTPASPASGASRPNVVILTVDTLRADRLSAYGYSKPTSPAIDRLLRSGWQFDDARTVEPLTSPAITSLFTSLEPDVHGASRNAIPMRKGLESISTVLARHGYKRAAFVSSWLLGKRLTGLDEHFDSYQEVLTRKRWWGLVGEEANADQVNDAVERWIGRLASREKRPPLLLWVHYVDPHAPYRTRRRFAERLRVGGFRPPASDRYDTEVAAVDEHLGRLVARLSSPNALGPDTLFVLTADHGESLGEHDYWGHGRNLYDEGLRIPLGIWWHGKLAPRRVAAPASILDVAPTVLGLLGLAREAPPQMAGLDWSAHDFDAPPPERTLWLQAHEGVALGKRDREQRASGLLEIGFVSGVTKQSWRLAEKRLLTFELGSDGRELRNLTLGVDEPPPLLRGRLRRAEERLVAFDPPAPELDDESIETLRALGYLQ